MWKKILSVLGFIVVLIAASIGGQIGKEVGKSAFAPSKPTQQQIQEKLLEGFVKGEKDNITKNELDDFKVMAESFLNLSQTQINMLIDSKNLIEISND